MVAARIGHNMTNPTIVDYKLVRIAPGDAGCDALRDALFTGWQPWGSAIATQQGDGESGLVASLFQPMVLSTEVVQ